VVVKHRGQLKKSNNYFSFSPQLSYTHNTSYIDSYKAAFGARYHSGARAGNTIVFAGGFHTNATSGDPIDERALIRSAAGRWSTADFGPIGFDQTKTPWRMVYA
jgi:hypothetical protein